MRSPGILTLIISILSPIAVLASPKPGAAPMSPTRLQSIAFSPDRNINLSGTILAPNQVAVDNLSGTVKVLDFPGVPEGVGITGYHQRPDGTQLLSFDSAVSLPASGGGRIT